QRWTIDVPKYLHTVLDVESVRSHYMRVVAPHGFDIEDCVEIFGNINCPTLLVCGLESYLPVPESDPRMKAIRNCRLVKVSNAGHWVHHDQLEILLRETTEFFQD
ncbi:MAG TPA: alpha/beta hydrolase, partial [Candidatus Acidoferrales bacterium]|nr:alpha/beta hydrolase [Candidatus Acidoferrales bacterium]